MALDAICLTAVVEELRRTLEGGKIDKIYQPSRDEVVMAIRGAGENVKLLLSASPNGPRMHLTKEVRENPAQPPMFCMLLRKHLTGGRILALEQPELERIVLLRLEVVDELGDRVPRTLVLEAMGRRANLILLDAEGRILDCIRRVEGDVTTGQRGVMPGLFYHLPEPHPGLSPLLERELDFRSDGESRNESLQEKAERLREAVGAEGYVPYLLLRDGKGVDFSFLPILQYGPGTQLRRYETFSRLLDDFYAARGTAERVGQRGQELLKAVKRVRERVERRVGQQEIERETTILISSHILSELSNIATHYGFLDQGRMLEQVSVGRLSEKCRACLQLTVDDASRAALVLEQRLGTRDYEVLPGNILRLYHFLDRPQDVTAALVEADVALFSAENKNTTLEDYFLSLIGGVRHG